MRWILSFLFPSRCQLCGKTDNISDKQQLCAACVGDFIINRLACRRCAIPLSLPLFRDDESICAECLKIPPVYDYCWSAFIYAQPLEWMIQQFKFNAKLNFAPLLSSLMEQHLLLKNNKERPDVIIPMPLHNKRLKQRGFNQSLMLAKPIAKALNIPLDSSSCLRVLNTEHQTGKNAQQRVKNIKNAFTFENKFNYQHVIIFDDVVTTGSSVSELTRILKQSGVKKVGVWSLARAEKMA